jgi:methylated-DNA-[protein]-cysteine S-methyltransferase
MSDVLQLFIDRIDTPIGELLLVADAAGKLRAPRLGYPEARMLRLLQLHYGKDGFTLTPARNPQTGGTAFRRDVWRELHNIPGWFRHLLGKTRSTDRSPPMP